MATNTRKTFAVFGASGLQGGGVISFFLKHPGLSDKFQIRAVTRNVENAKVHCIFPADQVVWAQADLSKPQSVLEAVDGADIVFGLNNFWEHCDYNLDVIHGKTIVDACLTKQVDWLIWSTQYFAKETTHGHRTFAPCTDGKAEVSEYLEQVKHTGGKNGKGLISTHVLPTFYWQNLAKFLVWPNEAGELLWKMPWDKDAVLPFVDSETDIGAYTAAAMLSDPKEMDGKYIHVGSEWISTTDMLDQFNKLTDQKMVFQQVTTDELAGMLPPSEGMRRWLPVLFETIGEYFEWGPDSRNVQPEHDKVLQKLGGEYKKSTWANYVGRGAFMNEYTARMDAISKTWARH